MKKIVAIDIGGTFIKHRVVREDGKVIKYNKSSTNKSNIEEFINTLINIVNEYKKKEDIIGVSISIPGFVNNKIGIVNNCTAFRFIEGYKLKENLESLLNIPVLIENDANCVALAEKFTGNAKECEDFICITIGTGIGGGIFLNGDLVRGKEFKGGEFCYMITKDEDGYMTLSENSSFTALSRMYCDYKRGGKENIILGETIFEEAKVDENINKIIEKWYGNIGRMVYNLSSILNPEKILIGGGISSRVDFLKKLEFQLNKIPKWNFIKCNIELCKHKNNAGIIGAAYNFFNLKL
ncbi:ROK family protein [Clostridium perfringens]|nr:ROK family protein [Clostridium perfringens]